MKYYAVTINEEIFVREAENEVQLLEQLKNLDDGTTDFSTVEIRPATDDEIAWYNSDEYCE